MNLLLPQLVVVTPLKGEDQCVMVRCKSVLPETELTGASALVSTAVMPQGAAQGDTPAPSQHWGAPTTTAVPMVTLTGTFRQYPNHRH